MSHSFPFRKVYGVPFAIATVTLFGLLSALFGDGVWDELSWFALTIPLAVTVWKYSRTRTSTPRKLHDEQIHRR